MLSRIKEYVFYTVKIYKNKPQKDFKAGGVRPVLNPPLTNERVRYITIVFKMLHSLGLFTDILAKDLPYLYCVIPPL